MSDEEKIRKLAEKITKGILIKKLQEDLRPLSCGGTVEIHDANILDQGICINVSMFIPNPKEGEDG